MKVNDAIETLETKGYTLISRGKGFYHFMGPDNKEYTYELWNLRMKAQHLFWTR